MHLSLQAALTFAAFCALSIHTTAHQHPYEAGAIVPVALPTPLNEVPTEADNSALTNQENDDAALSPPQITAAPLELRDARAEPAKKPKNNNNNGGNTTESASPATRVAPAAGMAFLGMLGAAMV